MADYLVHVATNIASSSIVAEPINDAEENTDSNTQKYEMNTKQKPIEWS